MFRGRRPILVKGSSGGDGRTVELLVVSAVDGDFAEGGSSDLLRILNRLRWDWSSYQSREKHVGLENLAFKHF